MKSSRPTRNHPADMLHECFSLSSDECDSQDEDLSLDGRSTVVFRRADRLISVSPTLFLVLSPCRENSPLMLPGATFRRLTQGDCDRAASCRLSTGPVRSGSTDEARGRTGPMARPMSSSHPWHIECRNCSVHTVQYMSTYDCDFDEQSFCLLHGARQTQRG